MRGRIVLSFPILFCLAILIATQFKFDKNLKIAVEKTPEKHFEGPAEFLKFHQEIRTAEDENLPSYKLGHLVNEQQQFRLAALSKQNTNARTQSNGVIAFKERGPANVPGRTRGLLVDPDDASKNTWYACSASGGVWKTTNAGNSWTLITPALTNLATTVIAMANSNHNTIYIGTGEGFGNVEAVSGNGMFKSIDRGVTWNYLPSTSAFDDINRAIVDPANENIIVVASNSGIYKSVDGGISWNKVSTRLVIQDLKTTPNNFNIQYATQNGTGVLKSTDAGNTWSTSNIGLNGARRIEIAISPIKATKLFASCQTSANAKLYVSTDAAATWNLVDVKINNADANYLNDQGWYGNTIACDPFDENVVYFGGVDLFQLKLDGGTTSGTGSYVVEDVNYSNYITLTNSSFTNGNFDVGASANNTTVEIRFGPGKSQKAHRFLVPTGASSGVLATNYSYQDYVNVPFEVWDITNNKQLMASFRDQGRDGAFNLINSNTDNSDATLQSREYLYVNNVNYNSTTPSPSITVNGGHEFNKMYFIWPVLASGATWPPSANATIRFKFDTQPKLTATTTFITDQRNTYGNAAKNSIVHPDHHNIVMIPMAGTTYKILNANDGGIFISNVSSTPGVADGNWTFAGNGYNTTQFYGADKRPAKQEYLGGAQDNGTWKSNGNMFADKTSSYIFNIGGDGFEVIWNNKDDSKLIGGSQNNGFRRSTNGGVTWSNAVTGLSGTYPFISKLANSKDNPDVLYTLSSSGVFKSNDFGALWALTPITTNWGSASTMDIEVSRANGSFIWAGSGMASSGNLRNIHLSKDGGKTFNPTNNYTNVVLGSITKLASHPTNENIAYALFSFAGKPKILRTSNLGQTWEDISGFNSGSTSTNGFPDVAVYCLYVRTDDPNILWAGTEIGIIESLDNGVTWNLLTEFPSVSVWDMKGQDEEIVIATHGRGIWTATLPTVQEGSVKAPEIVTVATSPQSKLVIDFKNKQATDSIQVFINSIKLGTIKSIPIGEFYVKIKDVSSGDVEVRLVGFAGNAPYASFPFKGTKLNVPLVPLNQYYNVFVDANDLSVNGLTVNPFGLRNSTLQSSHNYQSNKEATAIVLSPIIVAASNASFYYEDVALVQPSSAGINFGNPLFKDYCIVEATKDGLNWIPLADGYNASFNSNWLTAYQNSQVGTESLVINRTLNLLDKFAAKDTLLFRFRIKADADAITGWGWSVDNLYIQQKPTATETPIDISQFEIFPNPSAGKINIQYSLVNTSPTTISIIDLTGRTILSYNLGYVLSGNQTLELNIDNEREGFYLVKIKTDGGEKIKKIIIKR